MAYTFLRRIHHKYHKLGKKKGKKSVWRKPKGRDNKMREKRRGYPITVSVGYRGKSTERKDLPVIMNVKELMHLAKGSEIIIGKIGTKKKIEVIKESQKKGLVITNINAEKFLKSAEKQNKQTRPSVAELEKNKK